MATRWICWICFTVCKVSIVWSIQEGQLQESEQTAQVVQALCLYVHY